MLCSVDTCFRRNSVPAGERREVCYCLTSDSGRERGVGAPSSVHRQRRGQPQGTRREGIIRRKITESEQAA